MIDAEVDLVAVGEVSFATPRESVGTVSPANPLIARCIQAVNARGCKEVVRQRHGVENRSFDQAALVGYKTQWIAAKHAEGHQIPCACRPDRVARQIDGWRRRGCRCARVRDSREIAENALPRRLGQYDGRNDSLLYRPLAFVKKEEKRLVFDDRPT